MNGEKNVLWPKFSTPHSPLKSSSTCAFEHFFQFLCSFKSDSRRRMKRFMSKFGIKIFYCGYFHLAGLKLIAFLIFWYLNLFLKPWKNQRANKNPSLMPRPTQDIPFLTSVLYIYFLCSWYQTINFMTPRSRSLKSQEILIQKLSFFFVFNRHAWVLSRHHRRILNNHDVTINA